MNRINKFLQLSKSDQLLLISAIVLLAGVQLGLRVFSWSTLQKLLLKFVDRRSRFLPVERPSVEHIAQVARVASRYVPKATCLPQALAVQLLLIQNAYPAELQIGVARNPNGDLEAHAWVTGENGIIVGGLRDMDHFVPLSPTAKV